MSQHQRRTSLLLLCVVPVLTIFLWLGTRESHCSDMGPIKGYGGRVPNDVIRVLTHMVAEIQTASSILDGDADHIEFINSEGVRKSYSFAYGSLWEDQAPIIYYVNAFHFEYRDGRGNYLTRMNYRKQQLNTVGFTMRFQFNDQSIITNTKFKLTKQSELASQESDFRMVSYNN